MIEQIYLGIISIMLLRMIVTKFKKDDYEN